MYTHTCYGMCNHPGVQSPLRAKHEVDFMGYNSGHCLQMTSMKEWQNVEMVRLSFLVEYWNPLNVLPCKFDFFKKKNLPILNVHSKREFHNNLIKYVLHCVVQSNLSIFDFLFVTAPY